MSVPTATKKPRRSIHDGASDCETKPIAPGSQGKANPSRIKLKRTSAHLYCIECSVDCPWKGRWSNALFWSWYRFMPTLPLNVAEPVTAVFGVMLYPADEDLTARDRWEALTLAPFVAQLRAQGGDLDDAFVNWILSHCGPHSIDQNDLAERWLGGSMTGELVKVLLWLTYNRPGDASWSKAVEWLEAAASKGFTRSAIYRRKKQFVRVAHLWSAYSLNGRKVGDLRTFLGLSEQIRVWGQMWRRRAQRAEPLFGSDMWLPPEGWKHPDPNWPDRIEIPRYDLPSLAARTPRWLRPR